MIREQLVAQRSRQNKYFIPASYSLIVLYDCMNNDEHYSMLDADILFLPEEQKLLARTYRIVYPLTSLVQQQFSFKRFIDMYEFVLSLERITEFFCLTKSLASKPIRSNPCSLCKGLLVIQEVPEFRLQLLMDV